VADRFRLITEDTMFDYIIVGAGSAGCVLANRLSIDQHVRVLMLEAGGPDAAREIHIPITFSKLFKTGVDWAYYTEEQQHLKNRKLYWPRGKVLGGSSSINAMIYIRGNWRDYDCWAEAGATGWEWRNVEPSFERSLTELSVAQLRCLNPISEAFVEAAHEAGYPRNPDFNGDKQDGFGFYRVTQAQGRRQSAAAAFLKPAMPRKNLTVRTGALATGVVLEGTRARGVRYVCDGKTEEARVEREVILAGAR
jgi:choline dehydrogenase